jgi:hypothetical protein
MRHVSRGALCLLATVIGGALLWGWGCLSRPGGPTASASLDALEDEQVRGEWQRTQLRIDAKRAVILELLAQRLTLREAAARFAELDSGKSEAQQALWRANCPGDTDEERSYWTVLRFVSAEVQNDPMRARAVWQRLAAQLPCHLRHLRGVRPGFPTTAGCLRDLAPPPPP